MKYSFFLVSNDWVDKQYEDYPTLIKSLHKHWMYNGYVSVPNTSSLYGKSYDKVDRAMLDEPWFNVHGWLTYGEHLSKATPLIKEAYLRSNPEHHLDDDVWIFGYDTIHYGDDQTERDLQHCLDHTKDLRDYMEYLGDHPIEPDRDRFESEYEDEIRNVKSWFVSLSKMLIMDYLRGQDPLLLPKDTYLAKREEIVKTISEIIKQFPLVDMKISDDDFTNDQYILEVRHDVFGYRE